MHPLAFGLWHFNGAYDDSGKERKKKKTFSNLKKGVGGKENPPAHTYHPLLRTEGEGRVDFFARHKSNHVPDLEIEIKVCNATAARFSLTVNLDPVASKTSWRVKTVAPANQSRIVKHVLSWIKHLCGAKKDCAIRKNSSEVSHSVNAGQRSSKGVLGHGVTVYR